MKRFKIVIIVAIFALTSCSSSTKKPNSLPNLGDCDKPLNELVSESPGSKFLNGTQEAGGKVASYIFTGTGYTAEFLIGFSVIVSILGVYVYAYSNATNANSFVPGSGPTKSKSDKENSKEGKPDSNFFWPAPPLGSEAYKFSKNWRCPNLDPLTQAFQNVTSCLEKKDGQENLLNAYKTLVAFESSRDINKCLTNDQKNSLQAQMKSLRLRIDVIKPLEIP